MEIKPQLFLSKVMHKRLFPRVNSFVYNMYYLSFPLSQIDKINIPLNKFSFLSFYEKDYGYKDGSPIEKWARDRLQEYGVKGVEEIILITLPRVLGYVFNPVSFYFCISKEQELKAVICEVNNTFGETHIYICANGNNQSITADEWLQADKLFHVSPFLERAGHYKFRFDYKKDKLGIWIDFYDAEGNKKLITSLVGKFEDITKQNLRKAFWKYPLITFKTIVLIHLQAIKLVFKKIKYISKPEQQKDKASSTQNLQKFNDSVSGN